MSSNWNTMTLRKAGVYLIDCDHKTPAAQRNGYPYITIPQIKNGKIDLAGARLISREDLITWTRKAKPQIHDVVLSRRCNPGETAFVPSNLECAIGQNLVLLRSDGEKLYPPFLRWLVSGPEWWNQIQKYLNAGAIFNSLKCADIPNFQLTIPPLSTQRRIADILSSLDEKIELNCQTNVTLEAIAQAIFKEWFVDFNFPGATGEMIESEFGLIPCGWRAGKLGEIYKTASGGTPSRTQNEYYENGIYQWIKSKELNGSFIVDTEEKITGDALKKSSAKLLPKYSVLIAMYGATVGQVGIISNEATTNQAICAFIPNKDYPFSFVFQFLRNNKDNIISKAVGSAQQNISQDLLRNLEVIIPDIHTMKAYDAIVASLFLTIEENIKQSSTLTKIRDSLLPKLMSGEIEL